MHRRHSGFGVEHAVSGDRRRGFHRIGGGTGATTWHGFAEAIVAAQAKITGKRPSVEAIGTADYPTPAKRPANSELDSSLFAATFGYRAQDWRRRTEDAVATLLGSPAAMERRA